MNELALLQKQERLMAKSQLLRDSLSKKVKEWRPSIKMADKCLSALAWLRQHPIIPVMGLSLLFIKKPAWLLTIFRTVFSGWLSVQSFKK